MKAVRCFECGKKQKSRGSEFFRCDCGVLVDYTGGSTYYWTKDSLLGDDVYAMFDGWLLCGRKLKRARWVDNMIIDVSAVVGNDGWLAVSWKEPA